MGSACDELNPEDLMETLGISENSAVYEFTKAFARAALTRYENLGKRKGRVGRLGKIGGELFNLGAFPGCSRSSPQSKAIRKITALGLQSVANYVDTLMQAKTKISIISIINAKSSKSFDETFLLCFIVFALHTYDKYKHSLEYINLEGPGAKTKRENKLQAIQMLAEYAGALCFSALLKCGTKQKNDFLKQLGKKDFKTNLKSQWTSATLVHLYYWAQEVGGSAEKLKKVITPYEFFIKMEFHVFDEKDLDPACSELHFCKDRKENPWAKYVKFRRSENLQQSRPSLIPVKSYFEEDGEKLDFSWAPINFDTNIEKYARTLYSFIVRDESFSRDVTGTNLVKDLHAKVDEQNSKLDELLGKMEEEKCNTKYRESVWFQIQKPIRTFTGRLDCLANLHQKLKECTADRKKTRDDLTQTPLLVLAAPAGMGKTEVVRMYIQKYGHEYNHIVWIDAENPTAVQAQFRAKLAAELRVRTEFRGRPKPFETIVKEIYMKLCETENGEIRSVLIIFDNADSLSDVSENQIKGIKAYLSPLFCLDEHLKPTIVVTSRNKNWDHPHNTVLLCYPWTESECVKFCLEQLNLAGTAENQKDAAELGNMFNFNPSTLQAAIALILKRQKSLADKNYRIRDFIENYKQCGSRTVLKTPLIENSPGTGTQNLTLMDLWNETFKKIHKLKNGNFAIKIICFAAYLSTPCLSPTILSSLLPKVEKDDFEQALDILENYFLIEHSNNSLAIHPIIRDIIKETLKSDANQRNLMFQDTFLNHAALLVEMSTGLVHFLEASLKLEEISAKKHNNIVDNFLALTSHLTKLDSMPTKELENDVYLLDLICSISKSYAIKMDYNKIIEFYRALLTGAHAQQQGPEQTLLLTLKNKIGDVLMKQEKYADAKDIYIKVFTAYKKQLGRDHEDTLTTQARIGDALNCLGDYAGALKMFCAVLTKQKKLLDFSCDPVALTLKLKVATLLYEHGEYADALKLLERVLRDNKENGHGPGTDNVFELQTQSWIARILVKQEKYEEAIELYMKLIDTSENMRGPHHTDTLLLKCDYATALSYQGDHEAAKNILQTTFKYQKQNMGYTMLELAETENSLAQVLVQLNDTKGAIKMFAHVSQVRSAQLGPEHPLTLNTEQARAHALYCETNFNESANAFKKVLCGRKKALGEYHPDTILTLQYLSQSLFAQGKVKMAARFAAYLRELKVKKNFLVEDHPKLVRNQHILDLSIAKLPKRMQGVSKLPKPSAPPLLPLPAWIFVEAGDTSNISCSNPSARGQEYKNLSKKLLCCCTYKTWTQIIAVLQIMVCGLSFILNVFNLLPKVPTVYFIASLTSGCLLTLPGKDLYYFFEKLPELPRLDFDAHGIFRDLRYYSSYRVTLAAYSFIFTVAGSILYAGATYEKPHLLLIWLIVVGLEIGLFGIILMYLVYPIFAGSIWASFAFAAFYICESNAVLGFFIVFRHRRELREHLARVREELFSVEFESVNIA